MKALVALTVLALLGACGADGPPVAPSTAQAEGLAITGEAKVAVSGGF